ncbi:hypothetical protein LJB42_001242 [Komagataella kurtzmanii]|nr:hypothetical protein LJB42_001242 [Komagataella kurtzmanii]
MSRKRRTEMNENNYSEHSAGPLGVTRTIVTCKRCRIKKTKCDQKFPKCGRCARFGAECIGVDPATGRNIPRSYIVYLEERVKVLETQLRSAGIEPTTINKEPSGLNENDQPLTSFNDKQPQCNSTNEEVPKLQIPTSTAGTAVNGSIKETTGISFGSLMRTAVSLQSDTKETAHSIAMNPCASGSKRRDSEVDPTLLPTKEDAERFLEIYFAQSNSQLPILHREQFVIRYFEPVYGSLSPNVNLASKYTSINQKVVDSRIPPTQTWYSEYKKQLQTKLKETSGEISPEEVAETIQPPQRVRKALYFLNIVFAIASSVHLLQYKSETSAKFKTSALFHIDHVYGSSDRLESLQGLLLLTIYSLMRPATPGVWYVLGSALRLSSELGLHNENYLKNDEFDVFTMDMRRRLFWCVYSLDRQICFYLGRPFGIPESSISTELFSELDDALIVQESSVEEYSKSASGLSSYKSVSLAIIQVRKLQAEIQEILYYKAELPRKFPTLQEWKDDVHTRLENWKKIVPKTQRRMNCDFKVVFFTLNYHHTMLALYGFSMLNSKFAVNDYFQIFKSSRGIIECYKELLDSRTINYTWAGVHNLFMGGVSFLYALYHSSEVCSKTSLEEIQQISQDCAHILNSLRASCDAALPCLKIFEILTAAAIRLRFTKHIMKMQQGTSVLDELKIWEGAPRISNTFYDRLNSGLIPQFQSSQFEWFTDEIDLNRFFQHLYEASSSSLSSNFASQNLEPKTENCATPIDCFNKKDSSPVAFLSFPGTPEDALALDSETFYTECQDQADSGAMYKMISQVPSEFIWEQFFATPP